MPELKIRYGDCPQCGKGVVYEGGTHCSPTCWGHDNPPYPGQAIQQASAIPLGEEVPAIQQVSAPKKRPCVAHPDLPVGKRWEPVPKRIKVAPSAPQLPDVGAETDLVDYLASLE